MLVTNPTFGIKFGHVESPGGNPSEVVDLIWEPVENLTKDLHSLKQTQALQNQWLENNMSFGDGLFAAAMLLLGVFDI